MRLVKNYDICLQMSYEQRLQALEKKVDQTVAYLSVCYGLMKDKNGNEAVNEALQQAGECVQSFETVIRDLRHIHAAQSSCLASARKKPEVRILHYSSIKFTAKLWI